MTNIVAEGILSYVALLFALCVHEASHAFVADKCGDPSARLLGRVTLNPVSHIDIFGTVIMPIAMVFLNSPFLFGWAKPVPFNPRNLRDMRRDPVLIAIAGPLSNLALLVIFIALTRVLVLSVGFVGENEQFQTAFAYALMLLVWCIIINFVLVVFNLLPVPPLDGGHVLHYFLPPSGQRFMEQLGPFGILIALAISWKFFPLFMKPALNFLTGLAGLPGLI